MRVVSIHAAIGVCLIVGMGVASPFGRKHLGILSSAIDSARELSDQLRDGVRPTTVFRWVATGTLAVAAGVIGWRLLSGIAEHDNFELVDPTPSRVAAAAGFLFAIFKNYRLTHRDLMHDIDRAYFFGFWTAAGNVITISVLAAVVAFGISVAAVANPWIGAGLCFFLAGPIAKFRIELWAGSSAILLLAFLNRDMSDLTEYRNGVIEVILIAPLIECAVLALVGTLMAFGRLLWSLFDFFLHSVSGLFHWSSVAGEKLPEWILPVISLVCGVLLVVLSVLQFHS